MEDKLYFYRAKVVSVYDGDTLRADVDLGMKTWVRNEKFRLARINAPELRGADRQKGLASRDYLRELILGKEVVLETIKDREGKYGRYLVEVWLEKSGKWVNVNDTMVQKGFAEYVNYL